MQIELLKPHTHAGTPCAAGTVLSLDDDLAHWLLKTGVARVPATPKTYPKHEEKSK